MSAIREARLEEAVGLARAIDLTVVEAVDRADQPDPPGHLSRQGQGRGDRRPDRGRTTSSIVVMDCALSPIQQRNLEKELNGQGARPYRPHPGNLRPPRQDQGRHAAGRACASQLSAQPPGPLMDPSGAPARRLRIHGRPRRNPDRSRSPHRSATASRGSKPS